MQAKVIQPQGLIAVLGDRSLAFGDRHDAAMGLGAFDESQAEAALLVSATDPSEDPEIADAAGESLFELWQRQQRAEPHLVANMRPEARKFFAP